MEKSKAKINPVAESVIEHWKEFLPKKYAALEKAGKLESAALYAVERHGDEMDSLLANGVPWSQALELTREKYLFPPPEENYDEGFEDEEPPSQASYNLYTDIMRELKKVKDLLWEKKYGPPPRRSTAKNQETET